MSKDMLFHDEARNRIFEGVKKLAKAVKATLGPTGRNVVVKNKDKPAFITKDGVTVAKEIDLEDRFESLGAELVIEVASKTADVAGDGTTTAVVLAEAMLENGARHVASGVNTTELKRGIDKAVKAAEKVLSNLAKPVKSKEEIYQVASISANNDEEIGGLLADLIDEIGSDGVATIEKSGTPETFVDKIDGLQLNGGYFTHYFQNKENGEAAWDDPRILIYAGRITAARDLILGNGNGFLEKVLMDSRPIVIIADGVDGEALHALVMNRVQGAQQILAVKTPFSLNKNMLLEDIAVLTGGKVFSREAGHKLHKIDINDLGEAGRVVATKDKTLILGGKGDTKEIKARAAALAEQASNAKSIEEKRELKARAAKLSTGVAVIRVGGSSEIEISERRDRIEDALYATQAAVEDGIVPGGGIALIRCIPEVRKLVSKLDNEDQKIGALIVERILSSPLCQIAENAGVTGEVVFEKILYESKSYGYNARTKEYCDMYKAGIVDPVKVTKSALQNAASVAGLILTTDVLLVEKVKEE
jgi:chaperonin GroEL